MAWVNRDEQNTICEALDMLSRHLQTEAKLAAQQGDLPRISRTAAEYEKVAVLERRMYSYAKDR